MSLDIDLGDPPTGEVDGRVNHVAFFSSKFTACDGDPKAMLKMLVTEARKVSGLNNKEVESIFKQARQHMKGDEGKPYRKRLPTKASGEEWHTLWSKVQAIELPDKDEPDTSDEESEKPALSSQTDSSDSEKGAGGLGSTPPPGDMAATLGKFNKTLETIASRVNALETGRSRKGRHALSLVDERLGRETSGRNTRNRNQRNRNRRGQDDPRKSQSRRKSHSITRSRTGRGTPRKNSRRSRKPKSDYSDTEESSESNSESDTDDSGWDTDSSISSDSFSSSSSSSSDSDRGRKSRRRRKKNRGRRKAAKKYDPPSKLERTSDSKRDVELRIKKDHRKDALRTYRVFTAASKQSVFQYASTDPTLQEQLKTKGVGGQGANSGKQARAMYEELKSMARLTDLIVDEWGENALYSDVGYSIVTRLYVLNRTLLSKDSLTKAYESSQHALPYETTVGLDEEVEKRIKKREKVNSTSAAGSGLGQE